MKKFEEEFDKNVDVVEIQLYESETVIKSCNPNQVKALGKDWVSPEDHQAEIGKRKQQYEEHQEIYSKTAKKLNDAELELSKLKSQLEKQQPEIPEVPQFVADWYEENKKSLEWNICKTVTRINENTSHDEFDLWFCDNRNKPIETIFSMKNGYTVVKEKRFYLKHIEMSKRDVDGYAWFLKKFTDEELDHKCIRYDEDLEDDGIKFTQQEIDSMETGSYEQIKVGE